MLYFGTVILNMSEDTFWNSTPRVFNALVTAHNKYLQMKYGKNDKNVEFGYIDQIEGW
jgi:hypothetical protein